MKPAIPYSDADSVYFPLGMCEHIGDATAIAVVMELAMLGRVSRAYLRQRFNHPQDAGKIDPAITLLWSKGYLKECGEFVEVRNA